MKLLAWLGYLIFGVIVVVLGNVAYQIGACWAADKISQAKDKKLSA